MYFFFLYLKNFIFLDVLKIKINVILLIMYGMYVLWKNKMWKIEIFWNMVINLFEFCKIKLFVGNW